jgi:hypothetical protein
MSPPAFSVFETREEGATRTSVLHRAFQVWDTRRSGRYDTLGVHRSCPFLLLYNKEGASQDPGLPVALAPWGFDCPSHLHGDKSPSSSLRLMPRYVLAALVRDMCLPEILVLVCPDTPKYPSTALNSVSSFLF